MGSWPLALDAVDRWDPKTVCVAFDMDAAVNRVVARAAQQFIEQLHARARQVQLWHWDPKFKGVDDFLVVRRRGRCRRLLIRLVFLKGARV